MSRRKQAMFEFRKKAQRRRLKRMMGGYVTELLKIGEAGSVVVRFRR
jgi:hypothetical protein